MLVQPGPVCGPRTGISGETATGPPGSLSGTLPEPPGRAPGASRERSWGLSGGSRSLPEALHGAPGASQGRANDDEIENENENDNETENENENCELIKKPREKQ